RDVTRWESCSHGLRRTIASSPSRATANAISTTRSFLSRPLMRPARSPPGRTTRQMSSVAEKLQRKQQRQVSTKQVRLKLVYIDFWSAVKLSFLLAIACGVVLVVATIFVWIVLNQTGIFEDLDAILVDLLGDENFSITTAFS